MDTAKAANLFSCDPDAPLLKYVNAPIGEGKPVTVPLKPLYAGKISLFSHNFGTRTAKWKIFNSVSVLYEYLPTFHTFTSNLTS